MEKERIKIKGRVFGREFEISRDYEYPESLEEAIREDGKEKVLSLYLQMRIIKFRDALRAKEIARREKQYLEGLKGLDEEALEQIKAISPEIGEMVQSLIR